MGIIIAIMKAWRNATTLHAMPRDKLATSASILQK